MSFLHIPENRRHVMAYWLIAICCMVVAMILLGGITRLTNSGLSMVTWKPVTGWLPPLGVEEWQREFDSYRQFPEYQKLNRGMSLDEFKSIFWLEYLHRLWGRVIGLAFFVPAAVFIAIGWVDRRLGWHFAAMFVLGGLQGVLGWYMVKSGLVDQPSVSQYRLTAHLGAALVILSYMAWVALGLLFPERNPRLDKSEAPPFRFAIFLVGLIFITMLSGGLVAGLDAGLTYNTFPLMDGHLLPTEIIYDMDPWWLSAFEDIATVQFDHRILAETTFFLIMLFWWLAGRATMSPFARRAVTFTGLAAILQVTLGISTLLLVVPVWLAWAHQGGAVLLFLAALTATYAMRPGRDINPRD